MAQRSWAGAAAPTTITAGISGGVLSFSIASASGWPTGGATAFIAVIDRGKATEEKVIVSSRSGTVLTLSARGHDGTSAVAHDLGAPIEHCLDAESLTRFDRHVEDTTHDDHTQYQKESEKGVASGYASLDAGGTVPDGQISSLIARDAEIAGQVAALSALICPPGTYRVSAEAAPGTGWLACQGQTVSRTTYAALFAVLSATYNTGGEAGTDFRLPDGRGRTLIGAGTGAGLTARTLGQQTIGAESVTLSSTESGLPLHTHLQDPHTHIQNTHNHTQNGHNHIQDPHHHGVGNTWATGAGVGVANGADAFFVFPLNTADTTAVNQTATAVNNTQTATNQNTTPTNQNAGGTNAGAAHQNMQPSIVANLFIKT